MNDIAIKFSGNEITPQQVQATDLADVIRLYEDALAALVIQENPKIKREQIVLGLSQVETGSAVYAFEANVEGLTLPAIEDLTKALNTLELAAFPYAVEKLFNRVRTFTKKYHCRAEVSSREITAYITEDSRAVLPAKLTGTTTIYGVLDRVGGIEPRVRIKPLKGAHIHCDVTREQARELSPRIYELMGLKGTAVWNYGRSEITRFKVDKVLPYRAKPAAKAFEELSEEFGAAFDNIDPEQFVREIRGE